MVQRLTSCFLLSLTILLPGFVVMTAIVRFCDVGGGAVFGF